MENNLIQMAAYTIGPIFKPIMDRVQLYFTNSITNIVFKASKLQRESFSNQKKKKNLSFGVDFKL